MDTEKEVQELERRMGELVIHLTTFAANLTASIACVAAMEVRLAALEKKFRDVILIPVGKN